MGLHRSARETTGAEEDAAIQPSYLGLARRLRHSEHTTLGLWPVPASATCDGVPRLLANALAAIGATVGLVASRDGWCQDVSRGRVLVSSLAESVDLITPVWPDNSNPVGAIEQTLTAIRGRYAWVLLDLTGCESPQVHELAFVPGVAIVILVAQGKISEFGLAKLCRQFPAERLMGAVLMESLPTEVIV